MMYSQALRGWYTLAALLLVSISFKSENVPQNISYAKLFGTEQFLFVGLSKCYLSAELSPPPSTCPYHTTFHIRKFDCAAVYNSMAQETHCKQIFFRK
ncbi:unnamed protein product, partial [Gongylonema pulchrum]|uniref:Secreted protein n=1 Tax=Gongylonema pulchrum TaxID=637853 RepID=A0A183DFZ2_9BILA